ncbi:MAG TPA: hypothetical protein VIC29_07115 [Steroidobacteraceae bacterium]
MARCSGGGNRPRAEGMTMSDEKRGELTLGQQRFLERMQEAQMEGLSLPDFYRAHGLSMAMLYKVRRQLVQKGIVPPTRLQLSSEPDKFVQVRVQESPAGAELAVRGPVCRLRHPSGWLIACGMWPHPQWILQLMGEQP